MRSKLMPDYGSILFKSLFLTTGGVLFAYDMGQFND